MIKVRTASYGSVIFRTFLLCMILAAVLFIRRVSAGSEVTPMSVGQVILTSRNYEMGTVYDRNGEMIVTGEDQGVRWSSGEAKKAFSSILGTEIEETLSSRMTVLGNCPWVFGTEDNQLAWQRLFAPRDVKKGGSVRLTLDMELQEYVTELIESSGFDNSYVLVSDYTTGELLAVYGQVFYDRLHPGSTIKPILVAAALTADPALENYVYCCIPENHYFETENETVRINCVNQASHGIMDMSSALAYSCNGYFISLLQQVDREDMLSELKKWGFDTTVSYHQFMYWDHSFLNESERKTDYLLAAIGQANACMTPAGLHFGISALLSHGELAEPVWISEKKISEDAVWQSMEEWDKRVLCSPEIADRVVDMMQRVTESGTGRTFWLPGFAAKTGTAQKSDENGNLDGKYTVWTTGGLTSEETPYSITVCLDNVEESTGSAEAGKIARQILLYMTEKGEKE